MILQIQDNAEGLCKLLVRQLGNLFGFESNEEKPLVKGVQAALSRVERCFTASPNKYYRFQGEVLFNPFHADHYCIFLYWLSRSLFEADDSSRSLADRVFYLNRMMNSVDLYYEVNLPDIFFVGHPLGSVMGRAQYGTHFSFSQQCTVGNNKGVFPVIGDHVKMFANSMILGDSKIGDHVWISANTYLKDQDVPSNSIVFGQSPHLIIKPMKSSS